MARTRKKWRPSIPRFTNVLVGDPQRNVAQLKVRLPEPLRRDLERAAAGAGHSMNTEIVRRLSESFKDYGRAKFIANSLVNNLDDEVLLEMFSKYYHDRSAHDDDGKLFFKSIRDQAAAHDRKPK
jgi:hypothetical protein